MKKIVKKEISYQCSVCKTEYSKASKAEKCEARILEEKQFEVGDCVENIEPRLCNNEPYKFKGVVIKIIGPMPSDYEYESKWLGGNSQRLNSHVWQHEVEYTCPHCKEKKGARYYTPEIRVL